MTIYEIEQAVLALVDPETGELLDFEAFEALQMEREQKIENMACWAKDLTAQAAAIKAEEAALAERRSVIERKANNLKAYLSEILCGAKFESAKVKITYRGSEAVNTAPGFVDWALKMGLSKFLTCPPPPAPVANKTAIKEYLKRFGDASALEGVSIEKRQNLQIK
ncbi:MAG: siphovirus Gp157 family protein [Oscillospiraceae bacterium]